MAVSLKRKPFSWSAHFNPRPVVKPKMVLVPRKLQSTINSSLTDAIVYCTTIRKIGFLLMSFPSKSNLSFPLSVLSVYFNLLTYSLKNDANMFIHFCVYKYILRFCKKRYLLWLIITNFYIFFVLSSHHKPTMCGPYMAHVTLKTSEFLTICTNILICMMHFSCKSVSYGFINKKNERKNLIYNKLNCPSVCGHRCPTGLPLRL